MAVIVHSFPDPSDPTTPIDDACAWASELNVNNALGTYWVAVWVNRSVGAASVVPPPDPVERIVIHPGDLISGPGDEPFIAPALAEVFAAAEAAKASNPSLSIWDAFKSVIDGVIAKHHRLAPNTVV